MRTLAPLVLCGLAFGFARLSAADPKPAPVPLETAKDRARLLHEVYLASLDTMHERYFHPERAVLPARAMEDIFASVGEKTGAEARWISVSFKAMSVNHEPKTDFDRKAAAEISAGKAALEEVVDGVYRRATAVPLPIGCVGCHGGAFQRQDNKKPKFAGLVISIPVKGGAKARQEEAR